MDHSRKCMSIHAIVDNEDDRFPLSPPSSYKSQSPSPTMDYLPSPTETRRNSFHLPMSVEERRYRNKLASAKYRAKKQANIKSMSGKVSQLMANNTNLQKELNKVKQENEVLRAMLLSYQSASSLPQNHHHYQHSAPYSY